MLRCRFATFSETQLETPIYCFGIGLQFNRLIILPPLMMHCNVTDYWSDVKIEFLLSRMGVVQFNSSVILYAATFPLDLVRRRKQLEGAGGRARVYTTGLYGVFRHIIQTEGVRGLYRGILPEYYKVVPGVGICFMTYETLKMLLADIGTA